MAKYLLYGSITFSSTANATTAMNNMQSALSGFPTVVNSSLTAHPAGISRAGSVVSLSLEAPDEATAQACSASLRGVWSGITKTIFGVSVSKVSG